MSSLYFQIAAFLVLILITFTFFSKKRIQNLETEVYTYILIVSFFALALDIIIVLCAYLLEVGNYMMILNKFYFVTILMWVYLFASYIFNVSFDLKKTNPKLHRNIKTIVTIVNILTVIIIFLLPVNIYVEDIMYSYGPSVNFLLVIVAIYFILIIFTIFAKIKVIKRKKYYPVYILAGLILVAILINRLDPSILIITFIMVYIDLVMYFTIENPDMKMINELNIAKDTAIRANNFKTEFLSNMSHEVRTPLNAIVGFSESLTEEDLPTTAQESVKDIVMASNNLLEIVNSILDISKIEANKIEIVNTDYSTEVLLDELISLTKGRLIGKPLEFRTSFDSSLPKYLHGDHQRLKQIIINLLTNSVKYTKEGFIEFKINCVQVNDISRLIISVEDSGMGIKPEKIDKLFTKFERLDVQNNTTAEGTGLGLAITKKLVDLMGGKIVCQSVYGKGSRFTVAVNQKIVTGTPVITNQASKSKKLNIGDIDLSDKTILLVDDNVVNLKVASKLLQPYKVKTKEVTSGIECIELIKQGEKYDLILMDDMMPKMKGTEALHILKQEPSFNTPVVALTANAISGMREKYLNDGFDDYLAKPIDRSELDRVMKEYLSE